MAMEPELKFFIGRQPILDVKQQIFGYELLFRAASHHTTAQFESQAQASASVISSALSDFGLQDVLGDKFGFLNITAGVLHSEMLELLPIEQSVLEILETIELDDNVRLRCSELKAMGFKIALDDHIYAPEHSAFYKMVDIIKVDIMATDPLELPGIAANLRKYPVQLLAERVETIEVFEQCLKCGFELFQGYFFERPVIIGQKRIDPSGIAMMKLLQQLNEDWDINEVEDTFRENPSLTFNLLKLVNSVMIGLREKIKNIRHAIMILGINHLRRWVQLALFAGKDDRGLNSPLLEMAAVRGRLMELLIMQRTGQSRTSDLVETAFLTGILSLLDALYETPMEHVVESLNLSEDMADALLRREGQLGQFLELAEKLEKTDFVAVQELLNTLSISLDQLLAAQLDAFNWRNSIVQGQRRSS
ncbi:MAG: HDOD domain-containing protein [Trichlorobacter sp.]|uniref:EAL and HDOD domain-containing protein n=1 Tax=Trichlorobacter sp. TaxID=2911007 RepID=UPI00256440E9|nr:HDOD domain-containing protein [Trichlorobacter sp.]MDK9717905.1 HDOD domain-containing protein [Trichlorobacter sp.]